MTFVLNVIPPKRISVIINQDPGLLLLLDGG